MPRYFQSSTVSRAVSCSAGSFIFEPSVPMGGSWLGVLAVDEPTASKLAAELPEMVWEISEETYNDIKKKAPATEHAWQPLQPRLKSTPPLVAAPPAERPIAATKPEEVAAVLMNGVSLSTTRAQPPPEPLLEAPSEKRRKAA